MPKFVRALLQGAIDGAKQAPRDFAEPLVGAARWVRRKLDESLAHSQHHPAAGEPTRH